MDSFFIADKLRGIPLVSGGKNQANNNKNDNQETQDSARPAIQLEKRDVASSSSAGILFKSAGHTASTSNVRKQTHKPTTANWLTTTTTRRPPTTTTTRAPTTVTSRRKQVALTTATRKPTTERKLSNQARQAPPSSTTSTTSTSTTTTEASTSVSNTIAEETSAQGSSATTRAEDTRTTLKKFDKLINQYNQQQTPPVGSSEPADPNATASKTTLKPTTTAAQLPLVTQPFNQRRTQQPVLGPHRFQDGRSLSAGPNWVVFNRPDGGYSFFEVCVLLSSIIMVSTIVFVIISNWVRAFKRKRQKRMAAASQETGSRSPSMNLQTDGSGGDQARKISMISSGGLTTTTANTTSDATSSSFSTATTMAAKPESTLIDMATDAAAQVANGAAKSATNQLISASQNISSEIKQAASNISNKAMAIVQPTENQNAATAISAATTADSMSVMSDPLAEKMATSKQETGGDSLEQKKNINRSVSDLSALKLKRQADDKQPPEQVATSGALLEELFDSTAAAPSGKADGKRVSDDKRTTRAVSRVGSLESIELPPTLIESIKRADVGKDLTPDEAPSPNLLLGEREPQAAKQQKPVNSSVQAAKKEPQLADKVVVKPDKIVGAVKNEPTSSTSELPKKQKQKQNNGEKVNGKKEEEKQRPANPMGRDEPKRADVEPAKPAKSTSKATAATTTTAAKPATSATATTTTATATPATTTTAELKNHQVVVNKLDKRKTNLEIVDLRDESVTGKMRGAKDESRGGSATGNWISMDGVAVVQPAPGALSGAPSASQAPTEHHHHQQQQQLDQAALMSPSEIIESRFHVDYKNKRRAQMGDKAGSKDSQDSKATDYLTNNIESELEQDNKMRNRKYFVYIVHDGHFTAKKECIARIELPQKRRITLAEMRQLIANSQDISLTSLRRNRFKFVTETYRLLNENEDATILHQVYPTQGVFLKLNIPEQENQTYAFKRGRPTGPSAAGRLSTGSGGIPSTGSSLGNTTIASRQRAGVNSRQLDGGGGLPAIEVDSYALGGAQDRTRASSVGRRNRQPASGGSYRRTKSSLAAANRKQQQLTSGQERLPSIDMIMSGDDDSAIDKRRPFIGQPIAVMSDDRMRIRPRWKNWS